MTKSIMIQGTMSNAGKSILVGGLCRVFHQDGFAVAPFKSQNMALNSFITDDGLEMGRAQVMQAEAAGIKPSVDMNPLLLKPTDDMGSQIIANGQVAGVMSATDYYKKKSQFIPMVKDAYAKLSSQYEIIVIEGAGSPAEINLNDQDIVNMGMAKMADAPVLLVGDIDRGGVFAQIVGTMELLEQEERNRIKATIINKFRGDREILKPGLKMLTDRTHVPVCGVIPYFHLDIDDEDSLTSRFDKKSSSAPVDIAVIRLPRISNFTDFAALECMEEVSLRYVNSVAELGNPDAIMLPGSKNTMEDLLWMRQSGLEAKVLSHNAKGKLIFGICGGYQMLGQEIHDPHETEHGGSMKGMGLLPVVTTFEPEKHRTRVKGKFLDVEGILSGLSQVEIEGYEIHMGTTRLKDEDGILGLTDDVTGGASKPDGASNGNTYGCYVHGIFDKAAVSGAIISALLEQKGYSSENTVGTDMAAHKEEQYDKLAQIIRENMDMDMVYEILNGGNVSI